MARSRSELTSSWEAAEARLYPIVMTRPEAYARYLELVGAIADELEPFGTVDGLADAFDRAAEFTARAAQRSGVSTEGLDLGLAAGAAFALRYRRVVASQARADALARIERARATGRAWVTIAETGDPAGGPYLRLDLHLRDGACIQASVGIDAESGDPRYELEAFRADPRTGDRLSGVAPLAPAVAFPDRARWEEAIVVLRGELGDAPDRRPRGPV
jgi:hypothetical protein